MADDDVNPLHNKIDRYYNRFGAFLFASAVMAVVMIDPENLPSGTGFAAYVVPHLFLVTFFPWCIIFSTWIVSIFIRRQYHRLVGRHVSHAIEVCYEYIVAMQDILFVRVFVYIALLFVGVMISKWFYYHFDILYTLRTIPQFFIEGLRYFLDIPKLSLVIHGWVHKTFLGWAVSALHYLEKAADGYISQHPVLGIFMICTVFAIIFGCIALIRHGITNIRPPVFLQ